MMAQVESGTRGLVPRMTTPYTTQDILAGGATGYVETVDHVAPSHVDWTQAYDDEPTTPNPMRITGITFSPQGDAYFSHDDPTQLSDYAPHDLVYLSRNPNTGQPGLAVLIARLDDTLELWTYNLDRTLVHKYTGLQVDTTWKRYRGSDAVQLEDHIRLPFTHLDVLCDSKTIYYTDMGRTIFRYDITGAGTQLANFAQLELTDHHVYAAIKIAKPSNKVLVAMTTTGNGPRNALSITDRLNFFTDEVHPADSIYNIFERVILTGDRTLTVPYAVRLDLANTNAPVYSLGAMFNGCRVAFKPFVTLIGAN